MHIRLDLTSKKEALQFLSRFTRYEKEDMLNYLEVYDKDYDVRNFIRCFNIDLKALRVESLEIIALHMTTNNDNSESIGQRGLCNLQQALTIDTPLKKYLGSKEIYFDIAKRLMWVDGQGIDITYKDESVSCGSIEYKIKDIAHKIYNDYQIDGFLSYNNLEGYGGISRVPEFISNVSDLCEGMNLEEDWEEIAECYIIIFKVPFEHIMHSTFNLDNRKHELSIDDMEKIKIDLINKALGVVWNSVHKKRAPEIYIYLKPEAIVPQESILEIAGLRDYLEKYK